MPNLQEGFLEAHLNPLFLESIRLYWDTFFNAKKVDHKQLLKAKKNLVRFLLRRLFQPLYVQHQSAIKGEIFILAKIHGDGIGDYFALLKSALVLKQSHPLLSIQVAYTHQQKLPFIDPSDYLLSAEKIFDFQEFADLTILEPILEDQDILPFENQLIELKNEHKLLVLDYEEILRRKGVAVRALEELIQENKRLIQRLEQAQVLKSKAVYLYQKLLFAEAIVHIALAFNTFGNPRLVSKSMYFAENGNFEGIANYLSLNWFSMGLKPFEEGVFLRKNSYPQASWKDPRLPLLLWGKPKPDAQIIADYFLKRHLHLAYLSQITVQQITYIYLIVLQHKADPRQIDIVLPKMRIQDIQSLNDSWLLQQGITRLSLIDFDVDENEYVLWEVKSRTEKTLRLIHEFPLPASDFVLTLELSGNVVGCTGDMSLSDCLSLGKIPFYEQRQHKRETWEGFQSVAKYLKLNFVQKYLNAIAHYHQQPPEAMAQTLHVILQTATFGEEWKTLLAFFRKYYCFEDSLISHLDRHLRSSIDLGFKEKEEKIAMCYLQEKISAEDAYSKMESLIERKNTKI